MLVSDLNWQIPEQLGEREAQQIGKEHLNHMPWHIWTTGPNNTQLLGQENASAEKDLLGDGGCTGREHKGMRWFNESCSTNRM